MIGSLSRPLRILVVVSLALNVFLIAAAAVDVVGDGKWLGGGRPPRIMGLPSPRELRAVLPDKDEAILDQVLQGSRPKFHERMDRLYDARQAVADAIKADPFDPAKLAAAFGTLRDQDAALAAGAQDMLVDFISKLDADGRAKVAELLSRPPKRRD